MLGAISSLLHSSVDAFRMQQAEMPEPQARHRDRQPKEEKTYTPNNAVEVTLSPQAQALLRALEEKNITMDDIQSVQKQQEADAQPAETEQAAPALPAPETLNRNIETITDQIGAPEFDAETEQGLNRLFKELRATFGDQAGPRDEAIATDGADSGLTTTQQLKAVALFSELDRLLGNAGVYFGGDQLVSKMGNADGARVQGLKQQLTETIHQGRNTGTLTPAQESRIDAIFREITRLFDGATDAGAAQRKAAIQTLLRSGDGIAGPGGAGLDDAA